MLVALECVTMECLMDMLVPKLLSLQLNTCTRTLCSSFQKVDGKLMANFSLLIDLLLVIFLLPVSFMLTSSLTLFFPCTGEAANKDKEIKRCVTDAYKKTDEEFLLEASKV